MNNKMKVAVAGLGIHGSSAVYELASRECDVVGFDLYGPLHKNGSSHGRSRIIRLAYSESPNYVKLLIEGYKRWHALEEECGRKLLLRTGGLIFGASKDHLVKGALESAAKFELAHRFMTPEDVATTFPGIRLAHDMVAFYEEEAGILDADACVESYQNQAKLKGADLHYGEEVLSYEASGSGLIVRTNKGTYEVDKLLITTGPWAGELLADLNLPLTVVRQVVAFFDPLAPELYTPQRCPIYYFEAPEGCYYGFPSLPGQGLKFGRHDTVEVCTARNVRREIDDAETTKLATVLGKYLPSSAGTFREAQTCLYTNAPDRDFIVGIHPAHANVVFGSWCGGHGFKFGSVSGKVHADLVINGQTDLPIAFLCADRFQAATISG